MYKVHYGLFENTFYILVNFSIVGIPFHNFWQSAYFENLEKRGGVEYFKKLCGVNLKWEGVSFLVSIGGF